MGQDDPDSLWMAAITLSIFADEHTLAATIIERALTLNPNSAHAWNATGYVAYYQNQFCSAIEALHRAIRLSPLDPLGGYFSNGRLSLLWLPVDTAKLWNGPIVRCMNFRQASLHFEAKQLP